MAIYNKSLEDYFRIPVLIKPLTLLRHTTQHNIHRIFHYKYYQFTIDQRYTKQEGNPNITLLNNRESITQRLYFVPQEFNNDWPELEVIYKVRFAIGIIDQALQEKQIEQILGKVNSENGLKLIGIINFSNGTFQNLFKRQNMIKCGQMTQEQLVHFIDPWLYNCLSIIESQICSIVNEVKKEEEVNKTIVFNRMEQKFDQKTNKRRKRNRCVKLCADYYLMLHLYHEAYYYYGQAEEGLKKLDDFLWVLGCLQGKLAILTTYNELEIQDKEEYIEQLISQTYSVAKKTKVWSFQCQNYFKIIRLYVNQPFKTDELIKSYLLNNARLSLEDQVFLLFTTLGSIYEKCGLHRKKNYSYFVSSSIYANKNSHLNTVLLSQIRNSPLIKEWPSIYKSILQQLIHQNQEKEDNNELYIELLSKCGNHLTEKQIENITSSLNFSNNHLLNMELAQFIELKQFYIIPSQIKPKQNRIGNRSSPKKTEANFFMSWKKEESLLFEENEEMVFKFIFSNKIPLPIRIKITIEIHTIQPYKLSSTEQMYFYLEPNALSKFERRIQAKGEYEQIWMIDRINILAWNFLYEIKIPTAIKCETYEKQPQISLDIKEELQFEQTSSLNFQTSLSANQQIPFCLIKFNLSIYYSVDVGFQENQIILRQQDQYLGLDFQRENNIRVIETHDAKTTEYEQKEGALIIYLKKFKTHRRFISRIEVNLQYLRTLESKYQTTKQYKCKCTFNRQFAYEVTQISTPIIDQVYKNGSTNLRIIEKDFRYELKVMKNSQNNGKYKMRYKEKEYLMGNGSDLVIEEIRQKIKFQAEETDLRKILFWQQENGNTKGQIEIVIPFSYLMKESQKHINFKVNTLKHEQYQQIKIEYSVQSKKDMNLSHVVVLRPVQIEIERMYVMRGKNRIQSTGSCVSNMVSVCFSAKCSNSYRMGLIFTDGQIFWHDDLIEIHPQ